MLFLSVLSINFMAYNEFVFLCFDKNTFPNEPCPSNFIISKSVIWASLSKEF